MLGDAVSVPATVVLALVATAEVSTGATWRSLPLPESTIPWLLLAKIELVRIGLLTALSLTATPVPPLKAMVLPSLAAVPPMVLSTALSWMWTPSEPLPSRLGAGDVGADVVALDQDAGGRCVRGPGHTGCCRR